MTRALLGSLAILPRRRSRALLVALLAAAAMLFGQYRSKRPPAHALRAVGVLEWPAGSKGTPRLVPLIILADGTYYDASIYRASPVPMAVEPGTVYEGQEAGVAKGLFTISAAQELAGQKLWYGAGTWGEGESGSSASAGEEDRPVLRHSKPEETGAAAAGQAQPAPQAPTEQQIESDPNRPVLERGKPVARPAAAPAPAAKPAATPPAAAPVAAPPAAPAPPKRMVAVSDAQPGEGRSFVLNWSPSEKETLKKKAVALAEAEIAKYAIAPGGPQAVPGPLADLQVHFFDIYSDNAPEVVLSGRLPAGEYAAAAARASRHGQTRGKAGRARAPQAQPDIYVTLVARGDLDGNLRRIFVSVTDPSRLDAVPRLELVDAVDADGRGMGQLLFHKIGPKDTGLEGNVVLYRVDPDQLTELFDSWQQ